MQRGGPATRRWRVTGAVAAVAVLVIWSLPPWEWSTIDDPGFAMWVREIQANSGLWSVPWQVISSQVQTDLNWGLFRPAFWLYPILYVLPVGALHALRLAMFAVAVAGPVVALRRERRMSPEVVVAAVAVTLLASAALVRGLFFLSLQELSGAAFVGLGLMMRGYRGRTLAWLVAAWFKSPFSWLLIGHAAVLWRQGRRRWAVVNAVTGVGTLGASFVLARRGDYTDRYFPTSLYGIADTVFNNADNLLGVLSAGMLAGLVWWLLISGAPLRLRLLSVVLGIGFAGYSAQMLLWETSGYYLGPILYLAGASLVTAMASPPAISRTRAFVAVSGAWALVTVLVGGALIQGLETNQVIRSIVGCVSRTSDATWTMIGDYPYVFTEEGAVRIAQMAQMRDPAWIGEVTTARPEDLPRIGAEFLVIGPGIDESALIGLRTTCTGTKIRVLESAK